MSEEEKKAINYLKNDVVRWLDKGRDLVLIDIEENGKLHSILDLIEKQQEEIKEKEQTIKILRKTRPIEEVFHDLIKEKEYISKDKIRELLEKYDKDIAWANADDHYYFIKYINELLEEN